MTPADTYAANWELIECVCGPIEWENSIAKRGGKTVRQRVVYDDAIDDHWGLEILEEEWTDTLEDHEATWAIAEHIRVWLEGKRVYIVPPMCGLDAGIYQAMQQVADDPDMSEGIEIGKTYAECQVKALKGFDVKEDKSDG